ncbi:MAG: 30S ribosomal protein S6 [Patescibacteria group bacterium]
MEEGLKQYELILILSPQLEGTDLDKIKKEIEEAIGKFNGTINFKESEKRILAYPINKQGQGIFLISHVLISPENITNLSKQLKLSKKILRHIVNQVEIPKISPIKPKPIKKIATFKNKMVSEKRPSLPKEGKSTLEEIDKKLDELIGL